MSSLLLFMAVIALSVRSYWRSDEFSWGAPVDGQAGRLRTLSAPSGRGDLMLAVNALSFSPLPEPAATNYWNGWVHSSDIPWSPTAPTRVGTTDYSKDMLGFGLRRWRSTATSVWTSDEKLTTMATTQSAVFVPHWFLAIGFALLPAMHIRRVILLQRLRRRLDRGLCGACGYDLRSTPERCPECGALSASSPAITA